MNTNDQELNAAFESLAQQRVGALLVTANPYFDTPDASKLFRSRHRKGFRPSIAFANSL
jgi:hypothetical protein